MAYESYLNKDGVNREISMAEIGSGKHVIAGYVGKNGEVHRIPALGRIDHLDFKVQDVLIYPDGSSDAIHAEDCYIVSGGGNTTATYYRFYSDDSQTIYYGYIELYPKSNYSDAIRLGVYSREVGCNIQAVLSVVAIYKDGHELNIYEHCDLCELIGISFHCPYVRFNSVGSVGLGSWSVNIFAFWQGKYETLYTYDYQNLVFDNSDGQYVETEMDYESSIVISVTFDSDGGASGNNTLYGGCMLVLTNGVYGDNIDQDGNLVPFGDFSAPDSWGG